MLFSVQLTHIFLIYENIFIWDYILELLKVSYDFISEYPFFIKFLICKMLLFSINHHVEFLYRIITTCILGRFHYERRSNQRHQTLKFVRSFVLPFFFFYLFSFCFLLLTLLMIYIVRLQVSKILYLTYTCRFLL